MDRAQAFAVIQDKLWATLEKQGFSEAESYTEDDSSGVIYKSEATAYGVLYNKTKKCFELKTTILDEDNNPTDWKSLSQWLFDFSNSERSDAESIGNDFSDIVTGPKVKRNVNEITKPKRKKSDETNVDPLFFYNRFVAVFPDLKEAMNQEKIVFGQVRFATLTKEVLAGKCEILAKSKGAGFERMCEIFNDMYKDGDVDVRAIIIHGIFNELSEEAMANMKESFSDELKKLTPISRKLKGKTIKPIKKKKQNQIVATALNNANK